MSLGSTNLSFGQVSGVEIIAPSKNIGTAQDHIYLVGRSAAQAVDISLNGEPVRGVVVRDSVFHALLYFGAGLNEISVTPVYSDPTITVQEGDTVQVLCAPSITREFERIFRVYTFHGSTPREDCLACHSLPDGEDGLAIDSEWCFTCHTEMRGRFRTHIPRDEKACANCHDIEPNLTISHSGSYVDKNPCYLCHKDKIGLFAQDFIHGPVAGGTCTVCHDPHGSDFEHNLLHPVPVLCPTCHDMEEELNNRVLHRPFEEGRCSSCHDPHSTSNRWVLIKSSEKLCLGCHDEIGTLESHNHPYNVKPKRRLPRPLKLTALGNLECLSCHKPHSTNAQHLLRSDEAVVCLGCHPDR